MLDNGRFRVSRLICDLVILFSCRKGGGITGYLGFVDLGQLSDVVKLGKEVMLGK